MRGCSLPDGTVKASITTEVHLDKLDALETLLTVQKSRFALSMPNAFLKACLVCFRIAAARVTKQINLKACTAETITYERAALVHCGSSASPKF